ncbi:MAG: hypothetical protein ACJA1C_001989 [Crocinitomicaceae bacterium]|jgi:hypothetical protein
MYWLIYEITMRITTQLYSRQLQQIPVIECRFTHILFRELLKISVSLS